MSIILKNIMETLVLQKLDESLEKLNCCKCEQCRMDIATYALNRLPPKYVATHSGAVFSKLDILTIQYDLDIFSALVQGAEMVRKNPRHTSDDIEKMLEDEKRKQEELLEQEKRLQAFKDQEELKALEKEAVAELAATGELPAAFDDVDVSDLTSIKMSDLPPDLPNMEEIKNILHIKEDEKKAE